MPSYGHITHPGLVRDHNEDNYLIDEDLGIWIVADGMGGHACGEVASQIVVDLIHDKLQHGGNLSDAITASHEIVLMAADQRLGLPGMGSTVVAAQLQQDHYEVAWVGDSRAYLWEQRRLRQVTRDHSYVQQMLDAGAISKSEAVVHPHRNVITQAIGANDLKQVDVGVTRVPLYKNQLLLLCSDGLTDEVTDEAIAEVLECDINEQEMAGRLLQLALAEGGHDNITILIVAAPGSTRERPVTLDMI
ncbi:MAG TPA: serine/threonine-protein phosphatase [Gammaproteobacteria bacterium]|nr:serine/threonine-protein phosphatase [Gammaproteobacteria bacterium]